MPQKRVFLSGGSILADFPLKAMFLEEWETRDHFKTLLCQNLHTETTDRAVPNHFGRELLGVMTLYFDIPKKYFLQFEIWAWSVLSSLLKIF